MAVAPGPGRGSWIDTWGPIRFQAVMPALCLALALVLLQPHWERAVPTLFHRGHALCWLGLWVAWLTKYLIPSGTGTFVASRLLGPP